MGSFAAIRKIARELFALDARALALFRIALGLLLLADLLTRGLLLSEHYTAAGVLPLADLGHELPGPRPWFPYVLFPHLWMDGPAWQAGLFIMHGLSAAALCLGLRTRAAACIAWFLLVSLHARNPTLIYGADDLLRMMLLWSLFLPMGRFWSLDARLRSSRSHEPARAHLSFAGAALLAQVFIVYLFTWLCKSGDDWFQGSAIYYAMHLDVYASGASHVMRAYPDLLRPLSWAVFWFELVGPFLLFSPYRVRVIALLGFLAMQLGFGIFLSLGLFPWIAAAALLPFLRLPDFGPFARDHGDGFGRLRAWRRGFVLLLPLLLFIHVLLLNTRLATRVLPMAAHDFLTFGIRLDQTWCMFAPQPGRSNEWDRFIIEGRTGARKEVFPGVAAPGPALVDVYNRRGGRRRDYFTELHDEKHQVLYARYLCRKHKHDLSGGIAFVEIRLVAEDIPPPVYGRGFRSVGGKVGDGEKIGGRVRREELLLRRRCEP